MKFDVSEGLIVSEQCVLSSSYSKTVDLQAEVSCTSWRNLKQKHLFPKLIRLFSFEQSGEIYHFNIFVAEREACTSQLLLETQNVMFNLELQNKTDDNLDTTTSGMFFLPNISIKVT